MNGNVSLVKMELRMSDSLMLLLLMFCKHIDCKRLVFLLDFNWIPYLKPGFCSGIFFYFSVMLEINRIFYLLNIIYVNNSVFNDTILYMGIFSFSPIYYSEKIRFSPRRYISRKCKFLQNKELLSRKQLRILKISKMNETRYIQSVANYFRTQCQ